MHDQASPFRAEPRQISEVIGTQRHAAASTAREANRLGGAARPLELLCDPNSLHPLPSHTAAVRVGVVAGIGAVEGRPVACYAHDGSLAGGSVGRIEAEVIVHALRT